MAKTYYIFRHGETYFSKNEISYDPDSRVNALLLDEAYPPIQHLAEFLKDKIGDANFTSPYPRCQVTSGMVAKAAEKNFVDDVRLIDEWITENKETFEEFVDRFRSFVDEIEKSQEEVVSICSHGWPITTLVKLITTGEMKKEWLTNYIKPGEVVIIKDKEVEIKSFR